MAEALPSQLVVQTTASALREKSKLRRHFRRFDMLFFLSCTVVTLDTIGAVASNGAQGFTWLLFLAVFLFLPYALSIAELGSAFPQEGGPYVWTRLAFGRPLAAVNERLEDVVPDQLITTPPEDLSFGLGTRTRASMLFGMPIPAA